MKPVSVRDERDHFGTIFEYKRNIVKQIFALFLLFLGFSLTAQAAQLENLSRIARRIEFPTGDGQRSTCTGFFVSAPKCDTESSSDSQKPLFVTAAHCQYDSDLNPIHQKFDVMGISKTISLKKSVVNACHDMLVTRTSKAWSRPLPVAEEEPQVAETLWAMGFPVNVVGKSKTKGLVLKCSYEGVTESAASTAWRADLLQHQIVCEFPFHPYLPETSMGGMSGGPVLNQKGEVVGVVSQQRYHCPRYAKDKCRQVRLMYTELNTRQFDCRGRLAPQRSKSRYSYAQYLPWESRKPAGAVEVDFDPNGCVRRLYRSTQSPSFYGDRQIYDYSSSVPRL